MLGDGDSEESWEPSDEYLSNGFAADTDYEYEPGKIETYADKDRCKKENSSLQATLYYWDEAMPTNGDSATSTYPEPTIYSGATKRKLQGLHGKQATHFHRTSAVMQPIISVLLDAFQDPKKAREAQAQKWSSESGGQVSGCSSSRIAQAAI